VSAHACYGFCTDCGEAFGSPEWAKEPPTVPGWYWAHDRKSLGEDPPAIVRVIEAPFPQYSGPLIVEIMGYDETFSLSDFAMWAGPIEAPPLPEGEART
jgi:hypothetical protein